ncbi:MAG: nitroreductase family protein [Paludibacteraceae bacterium]|nr:nitroreductase family protein [Paludibacteraceae bacterium]
MKKLFIIPALAMLMVLGACNCKNDSLDAIMSRKSVRKFTNQPVEQAKIDAILKAGFAAPTAMNRQPWSIGVVNDTTLLRQMAKDMPYSQLETAAVAFVVCGDLNKAMEGTAREFWVVDCSLMAENMLLAAHSMGLGAVFTGGWPNMERCSLVAQYLHIPDSYTVLGVIPMGYPAENPDVKEKWNPDAVHYNIWE